MGGPTVQNRGTVKWEKNVYGANQGFTVWGPQTGIYTVALPVPADTPAATQGATIITACKPTRNGAGTGWISIVDVMYDQLCIGIANDTGQIVVKRAINTSGGTAQFWSGAGITIPDGQNTVLSCVINANGTFKVWSNGTLVWTSATTSTFTSLAKSGLNATAIGRNNYDGWTVFNGNIGDTFMYTVALSDTDRQQLETDLMEKFHAGASYPAQTITASTGGAVGGGTITPTDSINVPYEADHLFAITKNYGYSVDVFVDGVSQGNISAYTFTNVVADHTIAANFAELPLRTISGNVSAKAGGGATVSFKVTGSSLPAQQATTDASGNYTATVPEGAYYVCAAQTGYMISTDTVCNSTGDQTLNFTLAAGRNIPQMENLLFAAVTNQAAVGTSGNWPLLYSTFPAISQLTAIATPMVTKVRGIKYDYNLRADSDGYRLNTESQNTSIPVNGVTIVTLVKPVRIAQSDGFNSVVDFFYSNLILGIKNNTGQVQVRRNGTDYWSANDAAHTIPDGQTTILSLVLAADGAFTVYSSAWNNALETFDAPTVILTSAATSAFTAFVPAQAGPDDYRKWINVGRNNPDGWSSFNGYIGEVFVYKTALPLADRTTLEADITMVVTNLPAYNITSTAGDGGSISPPGVTSVGETDNQTYTITPNFGYNIADVVVDGATHLGAVTTYTFTAVNAVHTIDATFAAKPTYAVSGQVNASGGAGIPGATVYVSTSANASFSPFQTVTADGSGNYNFSVFDGTWMVTASATGYTTPADQTVPITGGPVTGVNFTLAGSGRSIPQMDKLLFSLYSTDLTVNGATTSPWPLEHPKGVTAAVMGTPVLATVETLQWEQNRYATGDGYRIAQYTTAIPVSGITAMAVVQPNGNGIDGGNWASVIDVMYSRFVLCVRGTTGLIRVCRNGEWADSTTTITNGTKTILTAVVQADGKYKVFANGVQIMDVTATSAMTSLDPLLSTWGNTGPGYWSYINVGRNNPDGWTTYQGNIGAAFLWKTALSEVERMTFEAELKQVYDPPRGTLILIN